MKVKVTKRVVFHKIADVTIDVPDNISKSEMDEWLLMNENEWMLLLLSLLLCFRLFLFYLHSLYI